MSGMILGQTAKGQITHFSIVGFVSVGCALLCVYLSRFLEPCRDNGAVGDVAMVEG